MYTIFARKLLRLHAAKIGTGNVIRKRFMTFPIIYIAHERRTGFLPAAYYDSSSITAFRESGPNPALSAFCRAAGNQPAGSQPLNQFPGALTISKTCSILRAWIPSSPAVWGRIAPSPIWSPAALACPFFPTIHNWRPAVSYGFPSVTPVPTVNSIWRYHAPARSPSMHAISAVLC